MDNSTGIYQIWTAPITLPPVNVEDDVMSIQNFILYQNYPNPFNPSTNISWQTSTGGWTTLKVYDILGNEVATLVNDYLPGGDHDILFNLNDMNLNLSSGVYFYRLIAGEFVETRRMVLLK
jgi:hypothetical protein